MRGAILLLLAVCGCATARGPAPLQPAASAPAYAWASFDGSRLIASGAYGLADRARGRALTIDDPARVASVTKLVVALGVMRMVEERRLELDRDVSDYLGWRLRNPAFPDRPITLRLLLSHRSSLRDEVDYAIPLGTTLRQAVADPKAFDATHPPGNYFRYSNLNFPVVASVMERVSGQRFDLLMQSLVLAPLRLDACFNWTTCSDAAIGRAVVLTAPDGRVLRDDLAGRRPDCPVNAPAGAGCDLSAYALASNGALFSPQGGLRISVRDLVTIGRLLLNSGFHDGHVFLRDESLQAMFGPLWRYNGSNGHTEDGFYCAYGLAVQSLPRGREGCADDLTGSGRILLGHAGDAYGVRSGLWIEPRTGFGIAYISIGNGDDPPRGRSAYRAIEEALAAHLPRSGS